MSILLLKANDNEGTYDHVSSGWLNTLVNFLHDYHSTIIVICLLLHASVTSNNYIIFMDENGMKANEQNAKTT